MHPRDEHRGPFSAIIGQSEGIHMAIQRARIACRPASTFRQVNLVGPTGSGKELFARAIHEAWGGGADCGQCLDRSGQFSRINSLWSRQRSFHGG